MKNKTSEFRTTRAYANKRGDTIIEPNAKTPPKTVHNQIREKTKKDFMIVNDHDANDSFSVEAVDGNCAAHEALRELGWWVAKGEKIEN